MDAGGDQFVYIDFDFKGHRNLIPSHGHDRRVRFHIVEIVSQRIVRVSRLRLHLDAKGILVLLVSMSRAR